MNGLASWSEIKSSALRTRTALKSSTPTAIGGSRVVETMMKRDAGTRPCVYLILALVGERALGAGA